MYFKKSLSLKYRLIFIAICLILFIQLFLGYTFSSYIRNESQHANLKLLQLQINENKSDTRLYSKPISKSVNNEWLDCHEANTNKESASALSRAKTEECRMNIIDTVCRHAKNKLLPLTAKSTCPLRNITNKGEYIGCFKDNMSERQLSQSITMTSENTKENCVENCYHLGFNFAGLQFGTECWCGNEFNANFPLSTSKCDEMKCPGNPIQGCGGFLTMNVYRTGITVSRFEKKTRLIKQTMVNKVRIVFLLSLNGRSERQILRLFATIYRPTHFYFIHVDKRQVYLKQRLINSLKLFKNVQFTNWSMSTIWGGSSLLTMHLKTMEDVLKFNWDWDYFINLSESDFTIKPLESLENYLTAYNSSNFLRFHGKDTEKFIRKQGLKKLFFECDNHLWRIGDREFPKGIRIDGGSDWFALSKEFVNYVVTSKDDLILSLKTYWKYSLLPSESFFHTVVSNSKFCNTVVNNNLHVTNWQRSRGCKCQYKHLVDWCGCSPNIFTEMKRILPLEVVPIFFARKYDPSINQYTIKVSEELSGVVWKNENVLNQFWLNCYSSFEDISSKDLNVMFYQNLIQLCSSNKMKTSLLNATLLFIDDEFSKIIIEYVDISNQIHECALERKWTWKRTPKNVGKDRLWKVLIGSEWDPKEEILRNWPGIVGQITNISVLHSWNTGIDDDNFVAKLKLIDPYGNVLDEGSEKIDSSAHTHHFKIKLNLPLQYGKWLLLILVNGETIAHVPFTVLTLNLKPAFNKILYIQEKLDFKMGGYENLSFIELIHSEWQSKDVCIGVSNCKQKNWSTYYSDPKSSVKLLSNNLLRIFDN